MKPAGHVQKPKSMDRIISFLDSTTPRAIKVKFAALALLGLLACFINWLESQSY